MESSSSFEFYLIVMILVVILPNRGGKMMIRFRGGLLLEIQGKGSGIMIEAEEERTAQLKEKANEEIERLHTEEFISLKDENCMIDKICVLKNPPNIKEEV